MAIRLPIEAPDAEGPSDARAFSSCEARLAELWSEHHTFLKSVSQRIVGDFATAEDIVQETYVRALTHLHRLDAETSLLPWLITVARRRSLNELRRRRHATLVDEVPDRGARPELDPMYEAVVDDEVARVRRALCSLTDRERELLLRQVHRGASLDDLAADEGCSVDSVKSVLKRARHKLRAAIADVGARVFVPVAGAAGALRRRFQGWAARLQELGPTSAVYSERLGQMVTAVVVAAVIGGSGTPAATAVKSPAAPPASKIAWTDLTSSAVVTAPADPAASADAPPVSKAAMAAAGASAASQPVVSSGAGPTPAPAASPPGPVPVLPPTPVPAPDVQPPDPRNPTGEAPADQPEDAHFRQVTAAQGNPGSSPAGTPEVFAIGDKNGKCISTCRVLFHSTDGGVTWARLPAVGLTGDTLLVAPAYPADSRIFAMGTNGLELSTDGGRSFLPVLSEPQPGPPAISPRFSIDDPTIIIGSSASWVYDASTGLTRPVAAAPLVGTVHFFAFAPSNPRGLRFVVGTLSAGPDGAKVPVVRTCDGVACRDGAPLSGLAGPPRVYVSSNFQQDGLVLAWVGGLVRRSEDFGATFKPVSLASSGWIQAVGDDGAGTLYAAVSGDPGAGQGGVFVSKDQGRTWTRRGVDTPLAQGAASVHALAGGRVIAVPAGTARGGVFCSTDQGLTWARRCAR